MYPVDVASHSVGKMSDLLLIVHIVSLLTNSGAQRKKENCIFMLKLAGPTASLSNLQQVRNISHKIMSLNSYQHFKSLLSDI
jgi:hypothetical protein